MTTTDPRDPGGFYLHEALHMTSFLERAVDQELVDHISIKVESRFLILAERARDALAELYQLIGRKHLRP